VGPGATAGGVGQRFATDKQAPFADHAVNQPLDRLRGSQRKIFSEVIIAPISRGRADAAPKEKEPAAAEGAEEPARRRAWTCGAERIHFCAGTRLEENGRGG